MPLPWEVAGRWVDIGRLEPGCKADLLLVVGHTPNIILAFCQSRVGL